LKKIEEKSATIADLERQLSMSKDSVNVIMQLEKKVKTQDNTLQELKNELLGMNHTNNSLEIMCKQQA
jgi:predicted RNase H-like nuclease (RuvC/YqgF family)